MKVKVTKNIIRDGAKVAGLGWKQILFGILAILIAAGTIFLLYDKLKIDLLMWIVFAELVLTIGFGIVQIQGMSLIKMLLKKFQGADKRFYAIKGVFSNEKDS